MTEEYRLERYEDGSYSCLDCGHRFEVPEGEPLECPICRQIREAPELKPCPFCGEAPSMEWIRDYEADSNVYRLMVMCRTCGAKSRPYLKGTDAAECWNRRATIGDDPQGLVVHYTGIHTIRYEGRASETGGIYGCDEDGPVSFIVPDGEPIECPIHREIVELTRDLRLCPYCGGNTSLLQRVEATECDPVQYIVRCSKCGCETTEVETPRYAAKRWNTRLDPKDNRS